ARRVDWAASTPSKKGPAVFLGLRTIVYSAPDLAASKAWWSSVLGIEPYFDRPFYVGFNPGGYELGLDPNGDPSACPPTHSGGRHAGRAAAGRPGGGPGGGAPRAEGGGGLTRGTSRSRRGKMVGLTDTPVFRRAPAPAAERAAPGR